MPPSSTQEGSEGPAAGSHTGPYSSSQTASPPPKAAPSTSRPPSTQARAASNSLPAYPSACTGHLPYAMPLPSCANAINECLAAPVLGYKVPLQWTRLCMSLHACCALQARPGKTAMTERNLFVLHVLQLLLGLAAAQPLLYGVSMRCWKLFLAVSALCHLYKASSKQQPAASSHMIRSLSRVD